MASKRLIPSDYERRLSYAMSTQPGPPLPQQPVSVPGKMPGRIFGVEIAYLFLLSTLFVVYETADAFRDALPTVGNIPIQVVWFGATGAVLAGLGGVFMHNNKWDGSYNYWHYSRPLVGGVVGGIGALLYYVSIVLGNTNAVAPRAVTFEAVAFLFGFGDKAFREQIAKLTKLLLGPGNQGKGGEGKGTAGSSGQGPTTLQS
jgi:uncharacterized membrane protein